MTEQTTLTRYVGSRESSHRAAIEVHEFATLLASMGKRVKITAEEAQDEKSILQRGFLHKAVFPQIAEQVVLPAELGGGRLDWRVWKEIFRARFLGFNNVLLPAAPRWNKKLGRLVQPKRRTPVKVRVSTEDLGIRDYSKYIDTVIDNAVVDYGVVFRFIAQERDAVRYVKPVRTPKPASRGAVETRQTEEEMTT